MRIKTNQKKRFTKLNFRKRKRENQQFSNPFDCQESTVLIEPAIPLLFNIFLTSFQLIYWRTHNLSNMSTLPVVEYWIPSFQKNIFCSKYDGLDALIENTEIEFQLYKDQVIDTIRKNIKIPQDLYENMVNTAILYQLHKQEELCFIYVEQFEEIIEEIKYEISLFPLYQEYNSKLLLSSISQSETLQPFYHRYFGLFSYQLKNLIISEIIDKSTVFQDYFNFFKKETKIDLNSDQSKKVNQINASSENFSIPIDEEQQLIEEKTSTEDLMFFKFEDQLEEFQDVPQQFIFSQEKSVFSPHVIIDNLLIPIANQQLKKKKGKINQIKF